jgi:hypothetical protein
MKASFPLVILLLMIPSLAQDKTLRVGEIEFFGTNGRDPEKIRASLPLKEGDELSFQEVPFVATIKGIGWSTSAYRAGLRGR